MLLLNLQSIKHCFYIRFENHTNKKTLKQAWRFFLLCDLFVTQAFGSSNFVEIIQWTYDY